MQHLVDLRKLLNGDDDEGSTPVLNDRFEIRELVKTTSSSKIYSGTQNPTITLYFRFRFGNRLRNHDQICTLDSIQAFNGLLENRKSKRAIC